nr:MULTISPECIES: type II toxin-antitoxin system HicB family antitoxin [unclassified Microcoleus]
MRYAIAIEKSESNYSAYVPDLPGCVATGTTVEEVEQEIKAAIFVYLEELRQSGSSIPEARTLCKYVEV